MTTRMRRERWLWVLVAGWVTAAGAVMPPLTDYRYDDGERSVPLKVPRDWTIERIADGVRLQRDPMLDTAGTVVVTFHEYTGAPLTPDALLTTALEAYGENLTRWQVLEREAPAGRALVRLATVEFRRSTVPCRGYVMTVRGEDTATVGFAYAEGPAAERMDLRSLIGVIVASTYETGTTRGNAFAGEGGSQAVQQVITNLYGDANDDFRQVWDEMDADDELDLGLLEFCSRYQPTLRTLKEFVDDYLTLREQERVKTLQVFCLPTADFNAFALGRNESGPGFLAFHSGLTASFDRLAQHYCSLRERRYEPKRAEAELRQYSASLARAVIAGRPLPDPGAIDFSDRYQEDRYVRVFYSMIGLVMAHEMAHYYLRHSESGITDDPFSVQQREIAADSAALKHLQMVADSRDEMWEGGAIHAFGFLATLDNLATGGDSEAEWMRTHPMGETRYNMALASLGEDNFNFRHDPWNQGNLLEHGGGGIEVVVRPTDLPNGGQPTDGAKQAVWRHPASGVSLTVPAGWAGQYDGENDVFLLRRNGQPDGLPLVLYSCGGDYPNPAAIAREIAQEVAGNDAGATIVKSASLDTGQPQLQGHVEVVEVPGEAGTLAVFAVGLQSPGWSHGLLLLTTAERLDQDLTVFEVVLDKMEIPSSAAG